MSQPFTHRGPQVIREVTRVLLALAVSALPAFLSADPQDGDFAKTLRKNKNRVIFLEIEDILKGSNASFDTIYGVKIPAHVRVEEPSTNLSLPDYVTFLELLQNSPVALNNVEASVRKDNGGTVGGRNRFPLLFADKAGRRWSLAETGELKRTSSAQKGSETVLHLNKKAVSLLLDPQQAPPILAFYDSPTTHSQKGRTTTSTLYLMVPSNASLLDPTRPSPTQSSKGRANREASANYGFKLRFSIVPKPNSKLSSAPLAKESVPVSKDSNILASSSDSIYGIISFSAVPVSSSDAPATSPVPDPSTTPDPQTSPTTTPQETETPSGTTTPASQTPDQSPSPAGTPADPKPPGDPQPTVVPPPPSTPYVPPADTPKPPEPPVYPPQDPQPTCGSYTHNLKGAVAGCLDSQACCRTTADTFNCVALGSATNSWGNTAPNCVEYQDGSSCNPQDTSACARKDEKLVCCPSLQDPTRGTCVTPDRCCQSTLPLSVNKSCIDPYGKQLGLFCCNTRPDVPIQQPGNDIDAFRCVVQGVGAPPATLPDGSKLDNGNTAPYCLPDCNKEKQNTLHPDGAKACCNTSCAEKFEWVPLNKIADLPSPPLCSNGNTAPFCALKTCSKDQQNTQNNSGEYCCATTCDPYQLKWVSKNQGFFCPPGSLDNPSGNGNKINACIKPCEDGPDSLSGTSPSMGDSGCDPKTGSCKTCTEEKDKCPDCNKPNMEPDPYTGRCRCIQDNSQQCLASGRLWNAAECSCDDVPFYSEFRGLGAFSFSAYQSGRFSPELFPDTNSPKLGAPGQESDPPDSADGKGKHGIILKSCGVAQRRDHTIGVRCEPLTIVDCADGRAKGMKGTCDSPCADPSRSGDEPSRDLCACLSEKCCQSPFVWDPLSQACTCQELKTVKLGPPQCPADSPTKLRLDTSECWCKTADSREWEMPSCPRGEFDSKSCSCVDVIGPHRLVNHPNARKDFNPRSCQYECHGDDQIAEDLCAASGGSFDPETCNCEQATLPTLQMQAFALSDGRTINRRFIIGSPARLRVTAPQSLLKRVGSDAIEVRVKVNNKECPKVFSFDFSTPNTDRSIMLKTLIRSVSPRFNKRVAFSFAAHWRQNHLGSIAVPAAPPQAGGGTPPRKDPLTTAEFDLMCRSASNFRE